MKKYLKLSIGAFGIVIGLIVGSISPAWAQNPPVMPPTAKKYGMTYEEWSASWWRWAYSLPVEENPLFDELGSCTNGASGQSGPVWFLTGVFNLSGTAYRSCTVPNGKALFFPIVNAECSYVENDGDDEEDFRACAKALADLIAVDSLAAEIDGVPIRNLQRYRFSSPLFTFGPLPANNVLQGLCDRPDNPNKPDCPVGTTSMAVADGYYLMLPPLSVGPHTVHFTGAIPAFNFTLDITYDLIVAPRKPQAGLPQSSKAVGLWNRKAQVPPK